MCNQRRALIVGINTYKNADDLTSCVADAEAMGELLERHEDGRPNYDCRILTDTKKKDRITIGMLREACTQLFSDTKDDVLLYFSGHGALTPFGGHLCAFDSERHSPGIPMQEIMQMAYDSKARDILMILDCCHSGDFGDPSIFRGGSGRDPLALLRMDMTVIAASLNTQSSFEGDKFSVFTASVLDALHGAAADHLGWVTAPSIYAYVERRFGWKEQQRPVYKSHATGTQVVRECASLIDRLKLHRLVELFADENYRYVLDPEYEPHDEHGNLPEKINQEKFAIATLFKDYRDAGLLKPSTPNEQLFFTARNSHTVELTPRGREYWWLVKNKKI